MEADEINGPTPENMAHFLEKIMRSKSPRYRYPAGPVSEKAAIALKKVMPTRLFEWLVMKYCSLL
jgi:hypothetical protein